MARFTTTTFVTASVSATSSLNHNEVIGDSNINIYKIKVVPSIVGVTSDAQLYEKDTFLDADRVWGTNPFTGTAFDPIQKDSAGVITEANRGFVVPYEDQDTSGEIHIKLVNNDSQAKTFTVTIVWEEVSLITGDDLEVDGNLKFKSGTAFFGTLDHAITAARTWTLPDVTATLLSSVTAVVTSNAGPHVIGGALIPRNFLVLRGSFTSDGSGSDVSGFRTGVDITGANEDTSFLTQFSVGGSITTQGASEAITSISSMRLTDPNIIIGTATVITTAILHLSGAAATEASGNDYGLLIDTANVRIGAVGTNDGHVHILSPNTTTTGLVVEVPSSSTAVTQRWQIAGISRINLIQASESNQFNLVGTDLGSDVKGPTIDVGRNINGTQASAGNISMVELSGTRQYIWPDDTGDLRIGTTVPIGSQDLSGIEVGAQMSWYKRKENIMEFVNYQSALDAVVETPLYSFDMKGRHFDAGYVIYEADKADWYSHNDNDGQIPCLNMRQLFGYHSGAIKALHARIKHLEEQLNARHNTNPF